MKTYKNMLLFMSTLDSFSYALCLTNTEDLNQAWEEVKDKPTTYGIVKFAGYGEFIVVNGGVKIE